MLYCLNIGRFKRYITIGFKHVGWHPALHFRPPICTAHYANRHVKGAAKRFCKIPCRGTEVHYVAVIFRSFPAAAALVKRFVTLSQRYSIHAHTGHFFGIDGIVYAILYATSAKTL